AGDRQAWQSLRDGLAKDDDLVVLCGAAIRGAAFADLAKFAAARTAEDRRTRFVALGDYANSRGAADMGLFPDRLPGYAPVADAAARDAFGALWGATLPDAPGLAAAAMLDAANSGRLQALYVVGANPAKKFAPSASNRLGKLELLIVQDLFL